MNRACTQLRTKMIIRGELDCRESSLTELLSSLAMVDGLDLTGSKVCRLPAGLVVNGPMEIWGGEMTELPDFLAVHGDLVAHFSEVLASRTYAWRALVQCAPQAAFFGRRQKWARRPQPPRAPKNPQPAVCAAERAAQARAPPNDGSTRAHPKAPIYAQSTVSSRSAQLPQHLVRRHPRTRRKVERAHSLPGMVHLDAAVVAKFFV